MHRPALLLALAAALIHAAANPHYGFFRDELYFIVCGRHPAFGYVDQPPVVPLTAALTQAFGTSLFWLRLIPALLSGASIYVTCLLVIEFGGGLYAQAFASIVAFFTPVLMSFGMKVSTDEVGLCAWPLTALFVLRIVKGGDPRLWLAAGATLGIAFESKYSALFFGVALLGGLLFTPQRTFVATRWFAAGAAVAVLIAAPNVLWQAHLGFPMWELLRNGANGKNFWAGPLVFLVQELFITNVFLAPVWIVGLGAMLRSRSARFLGYAFVLLLAQMIALHAKHYYPADAFPIPIAAGAAAIALRTRRFVTLRVVLAAGAVAAGVLFVPLTMPVLSEEGSIAWAREATRLLHVDRKIAATENGRTGALTQDFADMHGWPELARAVARVYDALPPRERARAGILAGNYGEAAALDFFGPQYGLPPVMSGHNQYWLWGTHGWDGSTLVDVNADMAGDRKYCRNATLAATFHAPYVRPDEDHIAIVICRTLKIPVDDLWRMQRSYI